MSDYDPCEDCRANDDDFYTDEDGHLVRRCYDCPLMDGFWEGKEE